MNIKKTTEYRDDDKAMFYSYDIGVTHHMWFTQELSSGNIYSVSIVRNQRDFREVNIYSRNVDNHTYFPTHFTASIPGNECSAEEMPAWIALLREAQNVMQAVTEFFAKSEQYRFYCKRHVEREMDRVDLGNYELDGVEFTDDDIDNMTLMMFNAHAMDAKDIVHEYLVGIREVLDAGLEDEHEEL